MEAIAELPAPSTAPTRLTPKQREVLLAYAQLGSQEAVAASMGISVQTIKNHLTQAYRRLGAHGGVHAIYLIMGGAERLSAAEPPIDRRLSRPGRSADLAVLRARVRILERELLELRRAPSGPRPPARAAPSDVPLMIDGRITLAQLRAAARRYDADMSQTSDMLMSAREWVDLLSYHIRPQATPLAPAGLD